jgi:AcrR family transcriptional regulator
MVQQQNQTYHFFNQILELYGRFGIRSMTMDDLARQLGMSKKTIYQLVQDKADLISQVIELDIQHNKHFITDLDSSGKNAIEDLVTINERMVRQRRYLSPTFYYDLKKYYPELYRRWTAEKRDHLYQIIVTNIIKGKREGLYREELIGEVIAGLYVSRMERMELEDSVHEPEPMSDSAVREVFIYHLHGICNRKGLDYLQHQLVFYHEK